MFTPTERRILALLADGRPHPRRAIHRLLPDDLGPLSNVQPHISNLRAKLRDRGETIVCELARGYIAYRHVRLLVAPTGTG